MGEHSGRSASNVLDVVAALGATGCGMQIMELQHAAAAQPDPFHTTIPAFPVIATHA